MEKRTGNNKPEACYVASEWTSSKINALISALIEWCIIAKPTLSLGKVCIDHFPRFPK